MEEKKVIFFLSANFSWGTNSAQCQEKKRKNCWQLLFPRHLSLNLSLSRRRLAVHFDFCLPFVCVGCRFFWPRATSRGCFYCRPMISLSWCESCPFLVVRASFASQPPLLARRESRRFFPTVSVSVLKGERCTSFNISAYINDDLLEPQAM